MQPTITVRDLWRGVLPPGTELLAGGAGIERRVEWATTLRSRPPAFDAVRGGELAFVPVRSIRLLDERLDLAQVTRTFAEKGGVAVAIVGDASAESLALAERLMLPLFRLPDGTGVAELQQDTVRYILDQRTALHEGEQQLRAQFTELALSGAGPAAIVDRLHLVTGHLCVWQDADGAVQHSVPPEAVVPELVGQTAELRRWVNTVPLSAADPPVRELQLEGTAARVVAPIPVRDGIGGFLSVVATERELGQLQRAAAARAAAACAIELDRERAVLKVREDMEGELLDLLLTGTWSSEESVVQRADRLGVALGDASTVVMVQPLERGGGGVLERTLAAAQLSLRRRAGGLVAGIRQNAVVIVVPGPLASSPELRAALEALRTETSSVTDRAVRVAAGRPHPGPAGVRTSYREAQGTMAMGVRLGSSDRALHFADLGLHRLLHAMVGHTELEHFYRDHVGTLVDYDERTGAGLMKTLDAYFHCHGSPTEMADVLHLHRNTVLYRLRRIEDLAGVDLHDPDTRLALHLSLKVRDVLRPAG